MELDESEFDLRNVVADTHALMEPTAVQGKVAHCRRRAGPGHGVPRRRAAAAAGADLSVLPTSNGQTLRAWLMQSRTTKSSRRYRWNTSTTPMHWRSRCSKPSRSDSSLQTLKLSCGSRSGEHHELLEIALSSPSLKRFDYSSSAADCAHALQFMTSPPDSHQAPVVLPTTNLLITAHTGLTRFSSSRRTKSSRRCSFRTRSSGIPT